MLNVFNGGLHELIVHFLLDRDVFMNDAKLDERLTKWCGQANMCILFLGLECNAF